ncbi:MAG TPA: hypothetical protein VHX86_16055 [Tepidisphaeraceae bacterium]|jgi:hypothetical protein|nr:hypothetical protein [Tepidisphaeraceae bacterium]
MNWTKRYKRTFIPTQVVIVGVCAVLMIYYRMPIVGVGLYFAVMELGALFGAMWTNRLVGKFERRSERDEYDLKVL